MPQNASILAEIPYPCSTVIHNPLGMNTPNPLGVTAASAQKKSKIVYTPKQELRDAVAGMKLQVTNPYRQTNQTTTTSGGTPAPGTGGGGTTPGGGNEPGGDGIE